jgi:hypothetical protein
VVRNHLKSASSTFRSSATGDNMTRPWSTLPNLEPSTPPTVIALQRIISAGKTPQLCEALRSKLFREDNYLPYHDWLLPLAPTVPFWPLGPPSVPF